MLMRFGSSKIMQIKIICQYSTGNIIIHSPKCHDTTLIWAMIFGVWTDTTWWSSSSTKATLDLEDYHT